MLGLLVVYLNTQNMKATGGSLHWGTTPPGGDSCNHKIDLTIIEGPRNCPAEEGRGKAGTGGDADVDAGPFLSPECLRNCDYLAEGNPPHPRCPWREMMVPWVALNSRHLVTDQCAKGAERNFRWMLEEDIRESAKRAFQDYGRPLETVTSFKYLERVLTAGDEK